MEQRIFLRSYCLIGMSDVEGFKEDLSCIAESDINYVTGKDIIIVTFKTTFKMGELEDFLKMTERTFIVFEATPGFFSANLNNEKFQNALFGGPIDNMRNSTFTIEDGIKQFMESLKEDSEGINWTIENQRESIQPTLDDLLDKIGEIGIENLSKEEKFFLNNYSKEKK